MSFCRPDKLAPILHRNIDGNCLITVARGGIIARCEPSFEVPCRAVPDLVPAHYIFSAVSTRVFDRLLYNALILEVNAHENC